MPGCRVFASVLLDPLERDRLLQGVFRVGSRSVMFRFEDFGDGDMFGAVIEAIDADGEVDDRLRVRLLFWNELAAIHATAGAKFEIWYARTVGDGVVLPGLADVDLADLVAE